MPPAVAVQAPPCAPCGYRPRQAFHSPLWRLACDHYEAFLSSYERRFAASHGPLRPEAEKFFRDFLRCGDPNEGVTLLRCQECRITLAVPFSCKSRACPSCVARRAEEVALQLDQRLPHVDHRHIVISLPRKMALRDRVLEDRSLFRRLARVIVGVLRRHMVGATRIHPNRRVELATARPGIIMAQHSWGDKLNFHPHWHLLVSDGVFLDGGDFYGLLDWQPELLRENLRRAILKAFVRWSKLTPQAADIMAAWPADRSGFSVFIGPTVLAEDRSGLQRLIRYLFRSPISFRRLHYEESTGRVRYQLSRDGFAEWDHAVDFLADLSLHIPQSHQQVVTYAGHYANATGVLNRADPESASEPGHEGPGTGQRIPWARLIARCWQVDPELCPRCGQKMKPSRPVRDRLELVRLLKALGRYGYPPRPPPALPPKPPPDDSSESSDNGDNFSQVPPGWDDWTD